MNRGWLLLISALIAPFPSIAGGTAAAQDPPFVFGKSVVNSANFMGNSLPGGGIAQGSIFTVFGSDLGPATGVQVSSFPLGAQFNGVSITVQQGTTKVSAIPIFVLNSQINAIMPSNTPLGDVSLQVSYNGQDSNWVPVRIVKHAPAVFTATGYGYGWGILQNFVSATNQPLNSGTNAISPGQVGTLWLTGSGPIAGADGNTPPVGNLPFPVEIFIGGVAVTGSNLLYAGRAPGISGLDQFVFYVPAGVPTGCFVPLYVRVNGAVSQPTTIAVMPQGGNCSDTHNPISSALIQGGKIVNGLLFEASTPAGQFAGIPLTFAIDKAAVRAMQEAGGQFAFDPFLATPPRGSCTGYTMPGNIMHNGFLMSSGGRPLGLGTLSAVSGGTNVGILALQPGLYNTAIGGGYPPQPLFFQDVTPSLRASGGPDGAAFDVPVPPSPILAGANLQALTTLSRTKGAAVTWNAQAGVSAYVVGGVYDMPTDSSALFLCVSAAGASSFNVPDYVLANLPVTRGVTDQGDARLFFSALPAMSQTTTPDQVRIFSARQDLTVLSISSVK